MNFIAATVELKSIISGPINAYGLDYRGADVVIPASDICRAPAGALQISWIRCLL